MGILLRAVTGDPRLWNLLARGAVTVSSENPLFPKAHLPKAPSMRFEFGSLAADQTITVDGTQVPNGGFEIAGLDGWVDDDTGTGTSVEETTTIHAGAKALKCNGGASGEGRRYRDIVARAGEWAEISAALRGNGTVAARVRVKNLLTGNWLDSAGAWGAQADVLTRTTASYNVEAKQFQVESFAACGFNDAAPLRVYCVCTQNGDAFFDEVLYVPGVDLLSVHGHNTDPSVPVQFRSSSDGSSFNTEATLTKAWPSFYGLLPARVFKRYWQEKLAGANHAAIIRHGSVAIAQTFTPLECDLVSGAELAHLEPDVASETPSGELFVHSLSAFPRRTFALRYEFVSTVTLDDHRVELFHRPRGRRHPMLLIPDTTKPDVLWARGDRSHRVVKTFQDVYSDRDLVVAEAPFYSSAA